MIPVLAINEVILVVSSLFPEAFLYSFVFVGDANNNTFSDCDHVTAQPPTALAHVGIAAAQVVKALGSSSVP